MRTKFEKIAPGPDGVWSPWQYPIHHGYKLGCCDCGLVHNVNFKITRKRTLPAYDGRGSPEGPKVAFQVSRNRRSTAMVRRNDDATNKGLTFLQFSRKALVEILAEYPDELPRFLKDFEGEVKRKTKMAKGRGRRLCGVPHA